MYVSFVIYLQESSAIKQQQLLNDDKLVRYNNKYLYKTSCIMTTTVTFIIIHTAQKRLLSLTHQHHAVLPHSPMFRQLAAGTLRRRRGTGVLVHEMRSHSEQNTGQGIELYHLHSSRIMFVMFSENENNSYSLFKKIGQTSNIILAGVRH